MASHCDVEFDMEDPQAKEIARKTKADRRML